MSSTAVDDSKSGEGAGYAKTSLNTVNRYRGRGQYEYQQVYPIIDEAPILHVAFHTSPDQDDFAFPVILPMLGCTGNFEPEKNSDDGRRSIYLHGYVSSRIMRLSRKDPPGAGADADVDVDAGASGIPVCVSATLMDGIVLALTPNHHSCNYRSAVAFGHACVVKDEPERLWAMELITDNLVPERWRHTRYPSEAELRSTGILRIDVHSASAKVRAGTTGEAREDLRDEALRRKVWAGVVPSRLAYGTPVPAPTNMFPGTPEYIEDWVEHANEKAERYSAEAAGL